MQIKRYLDNFIVIPVSFGLGLAISGHYLQGLAAIIIGVLLILRDKLVGLRSHQILLDLRIYPLRMKSMIFEEKEF